MSEWSEGAIPPNEAQAPAPHYWMYETSGVLAPAVKAFLMGEVLSEAKLRLLRAYLCQWLDSPLWHGGPDLARLREEVEHLGSGEDLRAWSERALMIGVDPW